MFQSESQSKFINTQICYKLVKVIRSISNISNISKDSDLSAFYPANPVLHTSKIYFQQHGLAMQYFHYEVAIRNIILIQSKLPTNSRLSCERFQNLEAEPSQTSAYIQYSLVVHGFKITEGK